MKKTFTTKLSYKAWGIIFLFLSAVLVTIAVSAFVEGALENGLIMLGISVAGFLYGLNHFLTKISVAGKTISYTSWFVSRATLMSDITRIVEASKMPRAYTSIRERDVAYAEARAGGTPMTGTTYFLDLYTGQDKPNISVKDIRHYEGYEELYSLLENATGKKVERDVQQWRKEVRGEKI